LHWVSSPRDEQYMSATRVFETWDWLLRQPGQRQAQRREPASCAYGFYAFIYPARGSQARSHFKSTSQLFDFPVLQAQCVNSTFPLLIPCSP
jgi:hypothetical protein